MPKAVTAIYKKPLTQGEFEGDLHTVLKRLKGHFLRRLRMQLLQTTFSKEYPTTVLYIMVQGETVPFDVGPHEPREDLLKYTIRPTRPIQPGDRVDLLIVFRAEHQQAAMVSSEERIWRFSGGRYIKGPSESEEVRIETLRLPARARCVSADPSADEIKTNETATLIWRRPMAANDQFEFSVEYRI